MFSTLSESFFDFGKLMPVFYPVFYIAAITADIAGNWNPLNPFLELHLGQHFVFFMVFYILLTMNSKLKHSAKMTQSQIQAPTGHILIRAAVNIITNGTRYFRGWCHKSLSVFQLRSGHFHSKMTDRIALCKANKATMPTSVSLIPPLINCQLHR